MSLIREKVTALLEYGRGHSYMALDVCVCRSTVQKVLNQQQEINSNARRSNSARKRKTEATQVRLVYLKTLRDLHNTSVQPAQLL